MESNETKINNLLATRNRQNVNLAFQLIKSQLKLDDKQAMLYILKYHHDNFWERETQSWYFYVNTVIFEIRIYEDPSHSYDKYSGPYVDMYLGIEIKQGQQKIKTEHYLNEADVYGDMCPYPFQFNLRRDSKAVFEQFSEALDQWLEVYDL
ncbi:MAG: hypothetical protein MK212_14785 [Saprospiraceae bacterium]|nr:hypothetical protein [Saprospiraceae bacterium]